MNISELVVEDELQMPSSVIFDSITTSGNVGIATSSPSATMDIRGDLHIGTSGDSNYIAFYGTTADGVGSWNHTYIGERKHGGNESSELLLWKGNDAGGSTGPDRIRYCATGGHLFQTTGTATGSFETVATNGEAVDRMIIANNGIVGIGTSSPTLGKLHVNGYNAGSIPRGYYTEYNGSGGISTSYYGSSGFAYSIYCSNAIGVNGIGWTSDERIKTEITVVDDAWALQKVRDIECKEYHYKDPMLRKEYKTIGYIAQDIEQHLPQAVSKIEEYVPDEMRLIENITWTPTEGGFKVIIPSLIFSSEHTRHLLFYVTSNSEENEQRIELEAAEDNSVVFEHKYTTVFLYGKKVNNFLQIAKDKIYSLHHSAIQEIDRRQVEDNERITELEAENEALQSEIALLKQQMATVMQKLGL
jgi:hypothetical protein